MSSGRRHRAVIRASTSQPGVTVKLSGSSTPLFEYDILIYTSQMFRALKQLHSVESEATGVSMVWINVNNSNGARSLLKMRSSYEEDFICNHKKPVLTWFFFLVQSTD
jgi:hypothetical protein